MHQSVLSQSDEVSTVRFKAEEAITCSKREAGQVIDDDLSDLDDEDQNKQVNSKPHRIKPLELEIIESEDCEVPIDEAEGIWNHTSRIMEDEGCVSMPNTKHSIFKVGPSRPGKMHSLETYNSQVRRPMSQSFFGQMALNSDELGYQSFTHQE